LAPAVGCGQPPTACVLASSSVDTFGGKPRRASTELKSRPLPSGYTNVLTNQKQRVKLL